MPTFRYLAQDNAGTRLDGEIEASSLRDAQLRLRQRGLNPLSVASSATVAAPPARRSVPPPAIRAQLDSVAGQAVQPVQTVKTKFGSDKDRFFIFTQLGSHLKAGINPAKAFENLLTHGTPAHFHEALQQAARSGVEGGSVAGVLRRYPYLFPDHVVALYGAGEQGGFLPEACEAIAAQAEQARKFGRPFVWLSWLTIMALVSAPLGFWVVQSGMDAMRLQDQQGGTLPGMQTYRAALLAELKWPIGPAMLAMLILGTVFILWWRSLRVTALRHRLTARLPLSGKRGWHEGMALFAWTLSHLMKAALAPRTALLSAADAIPNHSVREEIRQIGAAMGDNTALSAAFRGSAKMPPEFLALMQTGEMVGDMPGQLLIVSRSCSEAQQEVETLSKWRIGLWAILLIALGFVFVAWLLYGYMYPQLFKMFEV
ncbi:MAG: type II secretion system F family protein [Armatimonadetes bacterium]|nr:type II secretion system F family protein [Armatimonadota bacterium]